MKGKKVLISGGSGFIASHLVKRLVKDGATVAVIARYDNPIKCERLRGIWNDIRIIEADLRNRGALEQVKKFEPEIVFHMGAYVHVGQSWVNAEECFDINAKGTANILDACMDAGKFVYMSTSEVYGRQPSVPFIESMHPAPASPYAVSKYAGELYCSLFEDNHKGPSISIVRPFNVFGPYQSTKAVIPIFITKALAGERIVTNGGEQTREFVYVDDVIDGLIAASKREYKGPINLATGVEVQISLLLEQIIKLTGSKSEYQLGGIPYRDNEIWRMCGSNRRAKDTLGWQPKVPFLEGLTRTVNWFRQYAGSLKCLIA